MLVNTFIHLPQRNRKLLPTQIWSRQVPVAIACVLLLCFFTSIRAHPATSGADAAARGSSLGPLTGGHGNDSRGASLGQGKDTAAAPPSGAALPQRSWEWLRIIAAQQNGVMRQQSATEQTQAPVAEAPQQGGQVQQQEQQAQLSNQQVDDDGTCNSSQLAGGIESMQCSNGVHALHAGAPAIPESQGSASAAVTQDAGVQPASGKAALTPGRTPIAPPDSSLQTWVSGCVVGMALGWVFGVAWERRRQRGVSSSRQPHLQGQQTAQGSWSNGDRGSAAVDLGAGVCNDHPAVAGSTAEGPEATSSKVQRSRPAIHNGQQHAEAERKRDEYSTRQQVEKAIVTADAGDAAPGGCWRLLQRLEAAAAQPPEPAARHAGVSQVSEHAELPGAPTAPGVNGGSPGGATAHGLVNKEAKHRSDQQAVQPAAHAVSAVSPGPSTGRAVSSCPVSPEHARSGLRNGDGCRDEEGAMARTRSCPRSRGPGFGMGDARDGREGGRTGQGVRRLVLGGVEAEDGDMEEEEGSVGQRVLSRSSSCSSTAGMATDPCPTGTSANQPRRRLTWDDGDMRRGGGEGRSSRGRGALGSNSGGWADGAGAGGVSQGSVLQSAAAGLQQLCQRAASPEEQVALAAAATMLLQQQHFRQQQQQLCAAAGGSVLALPPAGGGALVLHPGVGAGMAMGVGPAGYLPAVGQAGPLAAHTQMGVGAGMVAHPHQAANVQSALILAAAAERFGQ